MSERNSSWEMSKFFIMEGYKKHENKFSFEICRNKVKIKNMSYELIFVFQKSNPFNEKK